MENTFIEGLFTYHAPYDHQVITYENIRKIAKNFALYINDHCPDNPDRSIAIMKLREAVMFANASIACEEVYK